MSRFIPVSEENFSQAVLQSNLPVLVEFSAEWCAPCKRMQPVLEQLAQEWNEKMRFAHVDVDMNANLAMQYNVMSVPTLILFHQGQPGERAIGLQQRESLVQRFTPPA